MLQVLLLILKILLWVLLGVLGLALLLLILVLAMPLKYTIDAEYYGNAKVKAKVSFLIVSIKIFFDQETKELTNKIRILGIPFKLKDSSEQKENKSKKTKQQKNKRKKTSEDVHSIDNSLSNENISTDTKMDYSDNDFTSVNEEFDLWNNEEDTLPKEEKKFFGRLKVFLKSLWNKLLKIKDFLAKLTPDNLESAFYKKTAKIRRTVNRFKQFWDMKCTIKTRAYLKKYIISVLKHIAPRKVKGYIHFGMDEPYKTGRTIGYLSMIPFSYQKDLEWEPDFYNKVMEGELYLKGKIRLGYIARIVLNINVWKTIKMATKITQ